MFDESWSLTTERLVLRPASVNDLPFLTSVWTDVRVRIFLGGTITTEEAVHRISPRIEAGELLVASALEGRQPVAVLCVSDNHMQQLEISYLLLPEYWRRGYATEAVTAVLGKLRQSFAGHNLLAITQAANAPSRNLLLRQGFCEERQHTEFGALQITYTMTL